MCMYSCFSLWRFWRGENLAGMVRHLGKNLFYIWAYFRHNFDRKIWFIKIFPKITEPYIYTCLGGSWFESCYVLVNLFLIGLVEWKFLLVSRFFFQIFCSNTYEVANFPYSDNVILNHQWKDWCTVCIWPPNIKLN